MKFIGIIPARYASTRFPAKPLAILGGKTVIQRVYEQVAGVLDEAYVATDDVRIEAAVQAFGGKVVMTSTEHRSGTDRCREALDRIEASTGKRFDAVVNIQGDEPFVAEEQLRLITGCFDDPATEIATLVKAFDAHEDIFNPNSPKVVLSTDGYALYFSRSAIPYLRGTERDRWQRSHKFLKHIGLYAYKSSVLRRIAELPQGTLEKLESLEQLRWLENGFRIKAAETHSESLAIDTPDDLKAAVEFLRRSEK